MAELYINGKVYTGNEKLEEAFVVDNGYFKFVGSNEDALRQDYDEIIDLAGKFVCPGFNDSHMHLLSYGSALMCAKLNEHTNSLKDMLDCLDNFIKDNQIPVGTWVKGRGWNQDNFTDVSRMPTRYDLDDVSKDRPIIAIRACGHAMVVNSKALELLGITKDTKQVEGGTIGFSNNEPNGQFFDNAMNLVYDNMPCPSKDELKDMILLASKALNSYGVTSSQTDDYCVYSNLDYELINEAYQELNAENKLTVRVYEQANITSLNDLKAFINKGHMTGVGDLMFKMGPLKMLGDGSLGSRTACLSIPYADDESTSGLLCFDSKTVEDMVMYAHENGMQIAIHAIGDKCLDVLLDAYEKALTKLPKDNHRHGVVHCQITRLDQLEKIKQLNLHIYAQSIFLDYDIKIVYKRVGGVLASTSYAWKTLLDGGIQVSNGTDCPVELPYALGGIECAVTRCDLHQNYGPYNPSQMFSVKEALDSYTISGAYASFEEDYKGLIKEKYLADFVVLDRNIFEVPNNEIKNIQVLKTYLGGKCIYQK